MSYMVRHLSGAFYVGGDMSGHLLSCKVCSIKNRFHAKDIVARAPILDVDF